MSLGEGRVTLPTVDEPIASTAALALRLASTLCHKDPATGESCAWYHGPWQLLRLLGLVMTPARHADFYGAALETAVGRRRNVGGSGMSTRHEPAVSWFGSLTLS